MYIYINISLDPIPIHIYTYTYIYIYVYTCISGVSFEGGHTLIPYHISYSLNCLKGGISKLQWSYLGGCRGDYCRGYEAVYLGNLDCGSDIYTKPAQVDLASRYGVVAKATGSLETDFMACS